MDDLITIFQLTDTNEIIELEGYDADGVKRTLRPKVIVCYRSHYAIYLPNIHMFIG